MEKELAELRERLAKVEEWKKRRQEIDEELNKVWVEGQDGDSLEELPPPPYLSSEGDSDRQDDFEDQGESDYV